MSETTPDVATSESSVPTEPVVHTSDDGVTTTTSFPDGTVRTDTIAKEIVSYPTLVIQIKTTSFDALLNELDSVVGKLKKLEGKTPANFQALLPNSSGSSSADYTLPSS